MSVIKYAEGDELMSADFNSKELREALVKHHTSQELRNVCADLGVPFDELEIGNPPTQSSIARELISWLYRHGRLLDLEPYLHGVKIIYKSKVPDSSTFQPPGRIAGKQRVDGESPPTEADSGLDDKQAHATPITVEGEPNTLSQQRTNASTSGITVGSDHSSGKEAAQRVEDRIPGDTSSPKKYGIQLTFTAIFGACLGGFLIWVFIYAPNTVPAYKQRVLAIICALLAGLFAFFFTGTIGLENASIKTPAGKLPIKATGGGAVFILVLAWWLSPLSPIDVAQQPNSAPHDHPNGKGGTERILTPLTPILTKGRINEVALNRDGDLLAAAEQSGTVQVWQIKSPESPYELTKSGKPAAARCVAFGPNGVTVAAGGDDGKVKIWPDHNSPSPILIPSHTNAIYEAYFSSDGQRLMLTGSDAGNVRSARLWSISGAPKLLKTFSLPNLGDQILTVSSNLLLVALYNSQHKAIEIWSFADRKLIRAFEDSNFIVTCGAFSQDSEFFVAGSDDGAVKRWRLKDGKQLQVLKGANERVVSIAFHPSAQFVVAGYPDGSIFLWNVDNPDPKETVREHSQGVFSITFSANGRVLASGGEDGKIQLWEIRG